jgi:LacI family transcriptional regulator
MARGPRDALPRRLTSRRIAALSGVSQTTVSRVLSNYPYVSAKTRDRVLQVLAETGYAPNTSARAMRTGSTGTLGVVVGRVTNPFYPELAELLHREVSEQRRKMTVWISDGGKDDSGELAALAAVGERSIDGVLYTTVTARSRSLLAALDVGAPVVLINRVIAGLACDTVASDNRAGASAAARHLLDLGHRRIAVVAGPQAVSTSRERELGFARTLRAEGIEYGDDDIIRGDFTHGAGRDALAQLLERTKRPPTALLCVNDVIAFGVLDEARERGLSVPDDLAVVGYDGTAQSAWPAFSLTTVRQPMEQIASLGVERLLERIADPGLAPRHERLAGELIVRGSTAQR